MNMRPPGVLNTMVATSDLLGDNSNDSLASWPVSLCPRVLMMISTYYSTIAQLHILPVLESEQSGSPDALWLQYAAQTLLLLQPLMYVLISHGTAGLHQVTQVFQYNY